MSEPYSASPWYTIKCTEAPYKSKCPYCNLPLENTVIIQYRDVLLDKDDKEWRVQERQRLLTRCEQFKYRRLESLPIDSIKAKRYYEDGEITEPAKLCCTMIHSCGKVSLMSVLDSMGQSLFMYALAFEPERFSREILETCERLRDEQTVDEKGSNIK